MAIGNPDVAAQPCAAQGVGSGAPGANLHLRNFQNLGLGCLANLKGVKVPYQLVGSNNYLVDTVLKNGDLRCSGFGSSQLISYETWSTAT